MRVKKFIGWLHLWLGLTSGLLVFIIAITGCLYAFQQEIQDWTQPFRFVPPSDAAYLPPSQLAAIAQQELPDKLLHSVKYNERHKAAEAIFYHFEPTYYYTVYLNPYTGAVQQVNDNESGFFHFVLDGHFYLWLPPEIGQTVTASATLVFVVMLISGIIMWWPKNRAASRQRFWFRWKNVRQWKRKNYDLHNITGFYASFLALVLALTGLVWGFQWFAWGAYTAAGGNKSLTYLDPNTLHRAPDTNVALDAVWHKMNAEYPHAISIEVHPPETDSSSIAANANASSGTYWNTDYRYFDQATLAEIPVDHIYGRLANAGFADKMMRMNYDIHVGAIGGLAGKILAFCISLMVASLPITGCCIWYGRTFKKRAAVPAPVARVWAKQ
jgi:uncharacterized iron-regulated membrane protein